VISLNQRSVFYFILSLFCTSCFLGSVLGECVSPDRLRVADVDGCASVCNAICYVNAGRVENRVNKGIFGTNLEWINCGNGIWNPNKGLLRDYVKLAREQGISVVRFPGGTFSDFYHWRNGIGTRNLRPVIPHFTDPGKSPNCFGTPELIMFCRAIGAQPLLTVNAGTGTAEEAASWVKYCNVIEDKRRTSDGLSEPVGVKLWEVGNELYLSGSDPEKRITVDSTTYAHRFLKFARAMKKVDPSISIVAIGVAHSYNVPFGPYKNWNEKLLSLASGSIDYLSLHNAYSPVLVGDYPDNPQDIYQAMWAFPIAVDSDLKMTEKVLSKYNKGNTIGIAITEWGPFFSISDPRWIDHNKTLGSAVYVGLVLQVFMKHPAVKIANYFKFTDRSFMGWVSYDHKPKVPFYALEMFTKHFGSLLVESHITCESYKSKRVGFVRSIDKVPELSVVSSINPSKDKLYVNIISRCWKKRYQVNLHINGFDVREKDVTIWQLSGKSALSNNGRDLPPDWPIRYEEPLPIDRSAIRISKLSYKIGNPLEIPPHSIVTVEFSRGEDKN